MITLMIATGMYLKIYYVLGTILSALHADINSESSPVRRYDNLQFEREETEAREVALPEVIELGSGESAFEPRHSGSGQCP